MANLFKRIYRKLRPVDTVTLWRQYGAQIGENVVICTGKFDKGHAFLIKIGNNVTISDAHLLTHDGSTKKMLGYSKCGRIEIGDDVFVGANAVILPNVKIGNRVIVGAGAIVTKDVPDNSVVVGNPARVVCTYDEIEAKNRELMKNVPVYDIHYSQKTEQDRQEMLKALENGGYCFDV